MTLLSFRTLWSKEIKTNPKISTGQKRKINSAILSKAYYAPEQQHCLVMLELLLLLLLCPVTVRMKGIFKKNFRMLAPNEVLISPRFR